MSPSLRSAFSVKLRELKKKKLTPVEVAVLDSGVDATHKDLVKRVVAAYRVEVKGENARIVEVPLQTNNDVYGHGTGVASIIARLAPNARIIDVRVLGSDNRGSGLAAVEGLRHAVELKTRLVNMSLAASANFSTALLPLCEQAYHQNQIIVASRRNMPLHDDGFPAEFSATISVDNETFRSPFHFKYLPDQVIEYAAHGEEVVVAAPGGGYTTQTGTSFATPTVCGLCALIVGAYPDIRPFELKTILKALARGDG